MLREPRGSRGLVFACSGLVHWGDALDRTFAALGLSTALTRRWSVRVSFLAAFPIAMLAVALVEGFVEHRLGVSAWQSAVHVALLWLAWSIWHSVSFPRHRARYLATSPQPYRSAFVRDIFPGVVLGFSQMLRPLAHGDGLRQLLSPLVPPYVTQLEFGGHFWFGLAVASLALATFFHSLSMLGVANTAFVPEFVQTNEFRPVEKGIYARARHPLFWSGNFFSCGLALMLGTPGAYLTAAVNLAYGLIYNSLEDRRLVRVFGRSYQAYSGRVRARIPTPFPRLPVPNGVAGGSAVSQMRSYAAPRLDSLGRKTST